MTTKDLSIEAAIALLQDKFAGRLTDGGHKHAKEQQETKRGLMRELSTCRACELKSFTLRVLQVGGELTGIPSEWQWHFLHAIVVRMKHHQERRDIPRDDGHKIIRTITDYNQRKRLGSIHGTRRDDRPKRGAWITDYTDELDWLKADLGTVSAYVKESPSKVPADRLLYEFEETLADAAPFVELRPMLLELLDHSDLSGGDQRLAQLCAPLYGYLEGSEFRALRRAIRDLEEEEIEEDERESLPEDWGWWHHTRGKRGVIIGGDPREINRARIQELFGFDELTWHESTRKKRGMLTSLRDAVATGGLDFVLVLRQFIGHEVDRIMMPVCREHGVPFVSVDTGYGTTRIRLAIEHFLEDDTS